MAIDERARYALHDRLRDVLGPEEATTLMAALEPLGWTDVARRGDLTDLRGEMTELRGEMTDLRGEMTELGAELRGEMAELRAELRGEMAELRAELHGEMAQLGGALRSEMAAHTRTVVFAMIGTNATLVALAFAAARLA
jgi:predicted  nucleic acid-binding Zn-ribbon protein